MLSRAAAQGLRGRTCHCFACRAQHITQAHTHTGPSFSSLNASSLSCLSRVCRVVCRDLITKRPKHTFAYTFVSGKPTEKNLVCHNRKDPGVTEFDKIWGLTLQVCFTRWKVSGSIKPRLNAKSTWPPKSYMSSVTALPTT